MATINSTAVTLTEWAKRLDPDGTTADVVEMLGQSNQILEDITFIEGNLPIGHRYTVRTGLPTVYWRLLNQGVPTSKSTTAQVDETVGMMEAYSEIDKDLLALNGNSASFRLSEDRAFIEAMTQQAASTILYGNSATDPKTFVGLAPRYGTISGAGNAQNIIDAGGTASVNTSIYLVLWGANTAFGIFPKGSKVGLQNQDLGEDTIIDAQGGRFQAMRTHYQWKLGLGVKDWRYVVRVCNIDTTNLVAESSAADLIKLLVKAIARIPNMAAGKAAFYANRTITEMLMIQALNKSTNALSVQDALSQFGNRMTELKFMGIPIRTVDQLTNTEARVV